MSSGIDCRHAGRQRQCPFGVQCPHLHRWERQGVSLKLSTAVTIAHEAAGKTEERLAEAEAALYLWRMQVMEARAPVLGRPSVRTGVYETLAAEC